jgi:hypothetical protein
VGERVTTASLTFSGADRERFRARLADCQRALERMLADGRFDRGRALAGVELELVLIGEDGKPVMANGEVLGAIASPDFQTELGIFNLELNMAPAPLRGAVFSHMAEQIRIAVAYADRAAYAACGAHVTAIGILPTLHPDDMVRENFSQEDRFTVLNDQIIGVRGEDIRLKIDGPEPLDASFGTILPEAANTSVQFHLQVRAENFAAAWNAAQAAAGPQLALGANSPLLFGRKLWHETRIALFEQATDLRPVELVAQGVRPRVWFGERWITDAAELFRENRTYFTALLPRVDGDEEPGAALAAGRVPRLPELRLHNGTVYRWNRPVYDIANGRPHLRVENRVMPAGPTAADIAANAAFFYGLTRELAEQDPPVWSRLSFAAARSNLHAAARDGIRARLVWPERGEIRADRLALDELVPLAASGLDRWGVDPADRDEYLGIIEGRVRTRRTGAVWQLDQLAALERRGLSRDKALAALVARYAQLARAGDPVHTWPVD